MTEYSGERRSHVEQVVRDMFDQCAECAEHRTVILSVCLTLMQRLAIDQPTEMRRAWAIKLYQLADTLAAEETSR